MKKFIFLLAILVMASFSFLRAQNLVQQNQDVTVTEPGKCDPHEPYAKDDFVLKYITGNPANALGNANVSGTRYYSGCMSFTQAQISNYVGATLHQINIGVGLAANMTGLTEFKIWIKTALDGPVVYQQTVTPAFTAAYHWENFPLTTNYTITDAPLVIGYTAAFTSAAVVNWYPLACSITPADTYKEGGFNYLIALNPTQHETGAAWNTYTGLGNLAIEALLTNGNPLPTNDLAASSVTSPSLKSVGNSSAFTVSVFNAGTASQNNYSVQLLDASNNVLATQAVTTAVAAGAFANVTVNYAPTTAGTLAVKGKVILAGDQNSNNDVSAPANVKVYALLPMGYCNNVPVSGNIGSATNAGNTISGAIGYPVANMAPFVGKVLTTIEIGFTTPSDLSNCTIWIRNSLTGTNQYTQSFTPVVGWNTITLTTPYPLTNDATFIGFTATTSSGYGAGNTANVPQNAANGGHLQMGTGAWTTLAANSLAGNNAIIGVVEPGTTAYITALASPSAGGTITGGGSYAIGAPVTLTATANTGYTFDHWNTGATTASITFNATTDATYTAYFTGGPVGCVDKIINTGTTDSQYGPMYTLWEYNYAQQIYDATEIGYSGENKTITKVAYNYISTTPFEKEITIYMANTDMVEFAGATAANFFPFDQLQQVYHGTPTFSNANEWSEIVFDAPFVYTGGNIVIATLHNTGYYITGNKWKGGTTTQYRYINTYSTSAPVNPANITSSIARVYNRPNVKFEVCAGDGPATCNPPTNLNVTYATDCGSAQLTWTAPGKGTIAPPKYNDGKPTKTGIDKVEFMKNRAARMPHSKPVLPLPAPKSVVFEEDFESATAPNLPTGWTRTTTSPTIGWEVDDYYYWGHNYSEQLAWSQWDADYTRNEWMFTPAIALTAGTQYTISFWVAAGYDYDDYDKFEVKIGNAATVAAMNAGTTVYYNASMYTDDDYIEITSTFTPTTAGNYYLGFHAFTLDYEGYDILIDDILITTDDGPIPGDVAYNIYRDGSKLNTTPVTTTSYTDNTFVATAGHTWEVVVACETGGESDPASKTMIACDNGGPGQCNPATNLTAVYEENCSSVTLNWNPPGKGKAPVINPPIKTEVIERSLQRGEGNTPADRCESFSNIKLEPTKTMWDVEYAFNAVAGAQPAVATDGINWYTGSWSPTSFPPLFCKYNMDGSNPQSFTIAGVALMRSLTYDGTYFYAGNGGNSTIYKLDLANQTLIGTITSGAGNTRHLTYDPTLDGGAGGFWTGDWTTLAAISMTGAVLIPNSATANVADVYGSAYDAVNNCVWLNTQTNGGAYMYKYNIAANTLTGPVYDLNQDMTEPNIGGGAFIYQAGGILHLAANIQGNPNRITVYEFSNANAPKAPTQFTATPVDYKANLAWTNPTQTTAGATLAAGSITKVVIRRNGILIHEITSGSDLAVGANVTWQDPMVPSAGIFCYSVFAVNSAGDGDNAKACVPFGDPCTVEVTIASNYGDAYIWSVKDAAGAMIIGATGGIGTFTGQLFGDATFQIDQSGLTDNTINITVKVDGTTYYSYSGPVFSGYNHTEALPCDAGGPIPTGDYTYNIYRDGTSIATNVTTTTYTDPSTAFDPAFPHTWTVKVACETGGESSAVSATLEFCSDTPGECDPATNLNVVYGPDCGPAQLTWIAPDGKGRNILVDVTDPKYDFVPEYNYVEKQEGMEMPKTIEGNSAMRRPAHLYQPIEHPITEPNLTPSRGNMVWGYVHYPTASVGYWKWDVDAISGKIFITDFPAVMYGGTFLDGYLYCYSDYTASPAFYKMDATSGTVISSTPRPELSAAPVSALSYDYTNNTMYALYNGAIHTVNLTTGQLTQVANITGHTTSTTVLTMAINLSGTMYIVNSGSANLYTVNKTSGAATLVGSTGRTINYAQSMAFDYADGQLYWAESESVYDNWMKINTTSGAATMIQADTYETTCLHFPYFAGDQCDPITNLSATANGYDVTLNWTAAPGNPTGYQISRNGTNVTTVTTTTFTETVANGSYNYTVKALFGDDCNPVGVSTTVVVKVLPCSGGNEITIGTGTTGSYRLPINTFYNYSYTQLIYDASEIGDPGVILSLAFEYFYATAQTGKANQVVYMGNISKNAFSSESDWVPLSQLTQVFSGTVPYNNSQKWSTIDLDVPFEYEGGNLVVAIANNSGTYNTSSNNTFYNHTTTLHKALTVYQDGSAYNPASPPAAGSLGYELLRPNVQIVACQSNIRYNVYRDGFIIKEDHKTTSYTDAAYDPFLDHTWSVKVVCDEGGVSNPTSKTLTKCVFEAECDIPTNLQVEYLDPRSCEAQITWDAPEGKGIIHPVPPMDPNYKEPVRGEKPTALFASNPNKPTTKGNPDFGPNDWVKWNFEHTNNSIGTGGPADFKAGARYTAADLAAKGVVDGDLITKVRFINMYVSSISQFTIEIYQGGTWPSNQGTLKYQQSVSPSSLLEDAYTEVLLTTPVVIDASQELWVVYHVIVSAGYPGGCDDGPMVDTKGNIMYWNDEWITMAIAGGSNNLFYNWIVEAFVETGNVNIAAAPTNFTATPQGTSLNCKLDWTNPTLTFGGANLTSITKMVVKRNGTSVQEFTTATPGQVMTYTDQVPAAGNYTYTVNAVTSEGNGLSANTSAIVGGMCNIKIVMDDSYGDGWNGALITVTVNGQNYGTATCSGYSSTATILIPSGNVDLTWTKGSYDSECSFKIFNSFDEELFSCANATNYTTGFNFFSYYNDCNPRTYVVRRDGAYIATVDKPIYIDTGHDPFLPHTWCVQVFCPDGGVSQQACIDALYCKQPGDCAIEAELMVTYQLDCTAELDWSGGKKVAYIPNDGDREVFYATKEGEPTSRLNRTRNTYIESNNVPYKIVPPGTPAPKGMVNVTLEAHDVWDDGSGYQLLLDQTATLYGTVIPEVGPFSTVCISPTTYDLFSHKIPTNADAVCTTNNIVVDGSVTIQIPAGTYDWMIANPDATYDYGGPCIWIAGGTGENMGRRDNYVFSEAYNYHFLMHIIGTGDGVTITTTNANPNLPAAPSNFTATPLGSSMICNLAWVNPTQTFGGATLTSITKMVLKRNNVTIAELIAGATPGAAMTFKDQVPAAGKYTYTVYAVNAEGEGLAATAGPVTVGPLCELFFEMWDYFGDGWNSGNVRVEVNGATIGTVGLTGGSYGTYSMEVPGGELKLYWNPGSFDCECMFNVYDGAGNLLYASPVNGSYPCGTPGVGMYGISGLIYTGDMNCGGGKMYVIYRDGIVLHEEWLETTYMDYGFDPYEPHVWAVTQFCPNTYESEPIVKEMGPCQEEPPCEDAEIATGTTYSSGYYLPIGNWNSYAYSQQIYDAADIELTPGSQITAISFQYYSTSLPAMTRANQTVYLGNTSKNTFANTTDWVSVNDLDMVYEGELTFTNDDTWTTFELQYPFTYDGGNLVIAWLNNAGSYSLSGYFYYHTISGKILFRGADSGGPFSAAAPGTGTTRTDRSNIKFTACEQFDIDFEAISINGNSKPTVTVPYDYTVTIRNKGKFVEDDYVVKVMTATNEVLAEVHINEPLAPTETKQVKLTVIYNTSQIGPMKIKGRVEIEGDKIYVNNATPLMNITVRPFSEDEIIDIPSDPWVGTLTTSIPFHFYYNHSGAQSVYLNQDINMAGGGGFIKQLSWFYNNTATSAIVNHPVKVYLANADINTLGGAFQPKEKFTLVYEGNVSIPLGLYQLSVTLDEPFLYTGGSLIVTTERLYAPYFNYVNAYTTAVSPSSRSQEYHSDPTPFNWTAGSALSTISNIEMVVKRVPAGSIHGTITECADGSPMSNVKVELNKYGLVTYTDADGHYSFPFVPAETDYTLSVTKFLYYDEFKGPFEVVADNDYTHDFCMTLRPGFLVYGVVQGSDGTYIEGATLKLTGYDNYQVVSGPYGVFEFVGVLWAKDYTLTVTADGWAKHESEWDILNNTNMGTIILYDITYPPSDVVAVDLDNYANISWGQLTLPEYNDWIKWCINDDIAGRVGWSETAGNDMTACIRFTPADLANLGIVSGHKINKIALGMGTELYAINTMEIRIWQGGTSVTDPGTLEYTFPLTGPFSSYPESTIAEFNINPYTIDATRELRIGWNLVNTAGYPQGRDAGPNVPGKGMLFYCADSPINGWIDAASFLQISANWVIKAFVTNTGKSASIVLSNNEPTEVSDKINVVTENVTHSFAEYPSNSGYSISEVEQVEEYNLVPEGRGTRGVIGYRLWRLQPGQENNPETWVTLTNNAVDAMEYDDHSWAVVPAGTYKWAVRTVYHGFIESAPAFSNPLEKLMKVQYIINVATNSGDSPAGAIVTLSNDNYTHTATVPVNSVTFNDVVVGNYDLEVTLDGYYDYTATIDITGPDAYLATLIEIITDPFDLKIDTACNNALFTWDHEFAGGKHFTAFTVFLNGEFVAAGIKQPEYMFENLKNGSYTAGVQANYSSGNSEIVPIDFDIYCTNINENPDLDYQLYPNPATNHIIIERNTAELATIDLYNAMGMHINSYETGEAQFEISVANLSAGTYFVRITEGSKSVIKNFVKK
ncbi:MAG: DUF2436 domain-containing protein [Bacteroidales bacterium]|jgi:hypothetical protein|nr:DUF2436 domain-containing protein [Bacteroidales bacterium]